MPAQSRSPADQSSAQPPADQPPAQPMEGALPFDLTPTEDQRLLVEAFSRFAANELRPHAQNADRQRAMPEGLLNQVARLGLHLMAMPADCGGVGGERDPVLTALAAEALAHGDMAVAIAAFAPASFVHALVDGGTAEQCRRWLTPLAQPDFVPATLAVAEAGVGADAAAPKVSASRQKPGGDWTLRGVKTAVPLGAAASSLLVTAAVADEKPDGQIAAFIVEGDSAGLSRQPERWMGLGAVELAELSFDAVRVPAENRLGEPEQPFDIERLLSLGRTGLAAAAVGVCQAVVDYCVPYCNERLAFGEPISHRQAVAFKLADAATETEAMRLMMLRAASRASAGLPFAREAWLARLQAGQYGMRIGSDGVQLLGGHGYIREHPVELWYRNLRAVAVLEGVCIL